MPRAAAQPPPAPAKVQALDADELPVLRAALRSLRDADAKRALQRHTSGPGYVLRKCAAHPALLDAVEDMLGPNIALLDISYFPTSAAAPPVEARTGPRNVYGWVSDDGIFELWSIAFAPSFNGEPCVRFAFGDASTGAASKPGACLLRGATGEEDAADERLAKRLKVAQYRRMDESTEDDLAVQCAVFNMDKRRNQADRVLAMLTQLRGIDVGTKVDLYEHSVQSAALALRDGRDEEYVVCCLLHDVGELLCPNAHGELPAALLRPYITPRMHWILAHHEVFQGYYYLDKCGGDKDARERFRYHRHFGACEEFCFKYDQAAFDPDYALPDLKAVFEPMVRRVLSREPYWHLCHLGDQTCEAKDALAKGYA